MPTGIELHHLLDLQEGKEGMSDIKNIKKVKIFLVWFIYIYSETTLFTLETHLGPCQTFTMELRMNIVKD